MRLRDAKPVGASVSSEVRAYMRERGMTLTDVVRDWYALEMDVGESLRLEDDLIDLEEEIANYPERKHTLERRIRLAKEREDRVRQYKKERDERVRRRRGRD